MTLVRIALLTPGKLFNTRETEAVETPAYLATSSAFIAYFPIPNPSEFLRHLSHGARRRPNFLCHIPHNLQLNKPRLYALSSRSLGRGLQIQEQTFLNGRPEMGKIGQVG